MAGASLKLIYYVSDLHQGIGVWYLYDLSHLLQIMPTGVTAKGYHFDTINNIQTILIMIAITFSKFTMGLKNI